MRRWLTPAAAVVALVVVAGGAAVLAGDDLPGVGGAGGPEPLRLRSVQGSAGAQDLAIAPGVPGSAGYVPAQPLPPDRPPPQPVWRFASTQPSAGDLAPLARSLGLPSEEPVERDGVRSIKAGVRELEVAAVRGAPWRFVDAARSLCPPPLPGGPPDQSVSCTLSPAGPPPPTVEQARTLAAPVFRALGMPAATARVVVLDSTAQVTVDPAVDGRRAAGRRRSPCRQPGSCTQPAGWAVRSRAGSTRS